MRSGLMIGLGVILLLGGIVALANPFAASLAVTSLVGAFLIVSGAAQVWMAVTDKADPNRVWTVVIGVVALIAGLSLVINPFGGLLSLTVLVGFLFLIMGAARLALAFQLQQSRTFWLLLISGAASAIIGMMVLTDLMAAATALLGLLLGIQLLADGIALLALGLFARRLP